MTDITRTEIAPQTVLGIHRREFYREQIPKQVMELFQYVEQEKIEIAGMPVFVCHETSVEEPMQAAEEGNADIEVAAPWQRRSPSREKVRMTSHGMNPPAKRW